jgi:hypothetical protein
MSENVDVSSVLSAAVSAATARVCRKCNKEPVHPGHVFCCTCEPEVCNSNRCKSKALLSAELENRARRLKLSGGKNEGLVSNSENLDDDIPETNPDIEFLGTNMQSRLEKNPSRLQYLIQKEPDQ